MACRGEFLGAMGAREKASIVDMGFELDDHHAGDRGRLHGQAALRGGFDQPVGHDAAAFAAQRGNQHGKGALRKFCIHERTASAGAKKPVTAERTLVMRRSHPVGFWTTSAR